MKLLNLLAIILFFSQVSKAQEIEIIKFSQLNDIINEDSDEVKIINFWATWCKPCIKELPYFELINEKYSAEKLKVILVSLDFVENVNDKVKSFITKKKIKSRVLLLDETDFNAFIDKVDDRWSGAIPATLILNNKNNKREFYEKEFKEGELEEIIKTHIN